MHGILSNGAECWRDESRHTSWPEILRGDQKLTGVGIYVYDYLTGFDSGGYSIRDAGQDLFARMEKDGVDSPRLAFVCHSMGGVVVRKMVVDHLTDLIDGAREIVLLLVASPSLGSKWATWLAPFAWLARNRQALALRALKREGDFLEEVDVAFMDLKDKGRLQITGRELIEDRPLVGRRFWTRLWTPTIVSSLSGRRYFGAALKVPGSDHSTIAKPADEGAMQHFRLRQLLLGSSDSADDADQPEKLPGQTRHPYREPLHILESGDPHTLPRRLLLSDWGFVEMALEGTGGGHQTAVGASGDVAAALVGDSLVIGWRGDRSHTVEKLLDGLNSESMCLLAVRSLHRSVVDLVLSDLDGTYRVHVEDGQKGVLSPMIDMGVLGAGVFLDEGFIGCPADGREFRGAGVGAAPLIVLDHLRVIVGLDSVALHEHEVVAAWGEDAEAEPAGVIVARSRDASSRWSLVTSLKRGTTQVGLARRRVTRTGYADNSSPTVHFVVSGWGGALEVHSAALG